MRIIAIYPGRFQPFGLHHKKVFESLQSEFGEGNVYIVTSNKTDNDKSPFNFTEKERIMVAMGIPQNQIKETRSPYAPQELFDEIGEEQLAAIFVYGEKDAGRIQYTKKDGSQGYYKAYDREETNLEKYDVRGYVKISPTFDIPIQTGDQIESMSGTTIRKAIKNGVDPKKVYGNLKNDVLELITNKLNSIDEDLYDPNNSDLDFMRSSEYKAGMPDGPKPDNIPNNYKYRDGGIGSGHYRKFAFGESKINEDFQGKELHAYDFDDTIAQVKANIKVFITSPSGDYNKEILIPADKFPEESKELEARLGSLEIKYDFSEFEKQISDAIVNSKVLNKLKDSLSRPEVKTTILTARSIGHPVTRYMREELGLSAYVVPLGLQVDGKVTGKDKANWIENHINKGYKTVYFIDDSEENRTAVAALQDKYPDVNLTVENPHTVSEMRGTMNNQEKAKHAKNMKRLSKDLRKQGDQYKEVPNYIHGTLKRKSQENIDPKAQAKHKGKNGPYGSAYTPVKEVRLFSKNWWSSIITEMLEEGETNVHMTHLEELILKKGQEGYNTAKSFILELLETLGGKSDTKINTSVKWDGAPAIVAGYDPEDGEFFVGTKNAFSNNPFLNKTDKDIDTNFAGKGSLIDKLKLSLKHLKPIWGNSPILQGDYMFGETKDSQDFDGVDHIVFKPNTIVYAVEKNSDLGKTIESAKMGIVFHTTYNTVGKGAPATFGADVSTLNKSGDVWFDDAWFDEDTGNVLITPKEAESIKDYIKEADSIKVDYSTLPLDFLNIYINNEIRGGQFLENPEESFNNFIDWYRQKVEKSTEKVKKPETKERKRKTGEENINNFNEQKENMFNVFKVSKLLSQAKLIFINKYNNAVYKTKHFKEAEDGSGDLIATNPEGYVAVDRIGSAVKLVDRLEFSKANFQTGKPRT